jgi:drug/metabolite transporter (DMT)-like permease
MWLFFQFASIMCWAAVNVLDSLLVKHYQKNPIVLGWSQSWFTIIALAIIWFFFEVETSWALWLVLGGMVAYVGDLVFWKALALIDVSVTTIAWAILSVFLAIAGFVFFNESWSLPQASGALLVIAGIVVLSLWQRSIGNFYALFLLPLLALLYVPFYVLQKAAIAAGQPLLTAFFWPLLGREGLFFLLPWVVPSFRNAILAYLPASKPSFYMLGGLVVLLFMAGIYLTTQAFANGPLSLVSIVSNVQPFCTIFMAWLMVSLVPRYAPRELLTVQSVQVKIVSFVIVFVGLGLLAINY